MKRNARPPQIAHLRDKVCNCIDHDKYTQTIHALKRESERSIDLPDTLYVLKTGRHEKSKTTFDEIFQTWKYAIRGRTLDNEDIRVVIAFDDEDMLIITVIKIV